MINRRIGLALSGGGVRAMAFHAGILKFLAENNCLEKIKYISTVSGGTLLIGLIYTLNNNKWPTSEEYLKMHNEIEEILSKKPLLSFASIVKYILNPLRWYSLLRNRRSIISTLIFKQWGAKSSFADLGSDITWDICATIKETGNRWKIQRNSMGDYSVGYTTSNDMSLADLMSISACVPMAIGKYKLKIDKYEWAHKEEYSAPEHRGKFKYVTLVDGGVYDNLGLESLYDIGKNSIKGSCDSDFIIVSDASAPLKVRSGVITAWRLLDITMLNINRLRMRNIIPYFIRNNNGIFIKLGSSPSKIISEASKDNNLNIPEDIKNGKFHSEKHLETIKNYKTSLSKVSKDDFKLLSDHGYELCKILYSTITNV